MNKKEVMSRLDISEIESRKMKEREWRRNARGKGLRWMLLRDIVAILSIKPLTNIQMQDIMMMYKGLTYKKTRELLDQLERADCIELIQEKDKEFYYRTTPKGILIWVITRRAIPATYAKVVLTTEDVKK